MTARKLGYLAVIGLLAACQTTGGFPASGDSPFPPTGRVNAEDAVDGLIVGHRLMAAGEYDLALKAYYRAAAQHGASVDVLSAIGSADLALGRLGQAEQILRRAIEVDGRFVPAWNNLGVVLIEKGEVGEASKVFETAFALDSGQTDSIRENLRLALAMIEEPAYDAPQNNTFALVRRGSGRYLLLSTYAGPEQ